MKWLPASVAAQRLRRGRAPQRDHRALGVNRDMARLLTAAFVSTAGDWLYRLALPLLVYQTTRSAALTAVTYALEYGPYIVLSPLAGVLADRIDRRRLLIGADTSSALIVAALVVGLASGVGSVPFIYGAALLLAILSPFYHPAIQSLVPAVVAAGDLTTASARLQSVDSVVSVVGPLAGGAVIALLGTRNALLADAASFGLSALLIAGIRARRKASEHAVVKAGVGAELVEAAAYVRGDRLILAGAVLFTGANFAVFLVQANLIYYLTAVRGFAPSALGVIFSADGAGALAGALLSAALVRRWGAGRVILGSTVAAGLVTMLLLWARTVPAVAGVVAVESAAGMVTAATWFSLRLQRVPDGMLGRVVALTRMVAFAAIPAAAVLGGLLLGATNDFTPLVLAAAGLQVILGTIGLRGPMNQSTVAIEAQSRRHDSVGRQPVADVHAHSSAG